MRRPFTAGILRTMSRSRQMKTAAEVSGLSFYPKEENKMDVKISKSALNKGINTVSKAILSQSPVPTLSGIKFEVTEDGVILTGSNTATTIQTIINGEDVEVTGTGGAVIEKGTFADAVKAIDDEEIRIKNADNLIAMTGGRNKFKLNSYALKEYPAIDLDMTNTVHQFVLTKDQIDEIANTVTYAANRTENKPVLKDVYMYADGQQIEMIATDSYRLAKKVLPVTTEEPFETHLPAALFDLSKSLLEGEEFLIRVTDKKVQVSDGKTTIQFSMTYGTYPAVKKLIPSAFAETLQLNRKELLRCFERIKFLKENGEKEAYTRLSFNSTIVTLITKSAEIGEAMDELEPLNVTGGDKTISMSANYMADALKAMSSETVTLHFQAEDFKAFIITPDGDDSSIHMVLPVRTYN